MTVLGDIPGIGDEGVAIYNYSLFLSFKKRRGQYSTCFSLKQRVFS
jgi:hypothetical protein